MKKALLSAVCIFIMSAATNAQTNAVDSSYKEYVGKYLFEPGEPVGVATIFLQDSSLAVSTDVTPVILLKKLGVDSFAVNSDGAASVAFRRDSTNVVTGLLLYTFSGRAVPAKKQDTGSDGTGRNKFPDKELYTKSLVYTETVHAHGNFSE